jgi:hypothetical protein
MADNQQQLPLDTPPPPADSAAPPPEAPAAPSKLVERMTAMGFTDVKDDNDAQDRLFSAFERLKEENATYGAQIKEALAEVRAQVDGGPKQPSDQPQRWWNPPQVDLAVVSQYRNADGSWKEGTPMEVRQKTEALEQYRQAFAAKLISDPESALNPLLERKFEEYFSQRYGQMTSEQQYQQELSANDWLWEKDPYSGSPTRRLSSEGKRLSDIMAEEEADYVEAQRLAGVPSQSIKAMPKALAFRKAMKTFRVEKAASKSTQMTPEEAAKINADKKAGLLGAAAPPVNRSGALPEAGAPKNKNLSPGQRLAQTMHMNGTFKNT